MARKKYIDLNANPSLIDTDIIAVSKNGSGSRRSTLLEVKDYIDVNEYNNFVSVASGTRAVLEAESGTIFNNTGNVSFNLPTGLTKAPK